MPPDAGSVRQQARRAGLLYVLMMVPAFFALIYLPGKMTVVGDAAATARRIGDAVLLYRVGVLCDLLTAVLFFYVAWTLNGLVADTDRRLAALMVVLVAIAVAFEMTNVVTMMAPLTYLGGDAFLAPFTIPQREALAYSFLRLRSSGLQVVNVFWGLWLFPFGLLVRRSGWFPRVLGTLLIAAGVALLVESFVGIVLPAYRSVVAMPATLVDTLGEVPIALWLLIVGARPRTPVVAATARSA